MAKNPLFGVTWDLVPRRSKFTSAAWNPETESRAYRQVRGGYGLIVSGVRNGSEYSWGYTALYDGQDHKVTGRNDVDAIEAYRVTPLITIGFFKKRGKEVAAYKRTIQSDGGTLAVVASGINPDGSIYFDTITYRAQ